MKGIGRYYVLYGVLGFLAVIVVLTVLEPFLPPLEEEDAEYY